MVYIIKKSPLLKITNDDLQTVWESLKRSIANERSAVDRFREQLGKIECNRQILAKAVMQKYYDIFCSISYTSTINVQKLLENEIQDFNKMGLTDFKVYEDLHLQMRFNTDNWDKEILDWFERMKNSRSEAIRYEKLKELISKNESLKRVDEVFLYDSEALSALKRLNGTLSSIYESIRNWQSDIIIFDTLSVSHCNEKLTDAATEFNSSVTKLIDSCNSALQTSFGKYRNEVEYFKEEDNDFTRYENIEILDEAIRNLESFYKNVGTKFQDSWYHYSNEVQDTIANICSFLCDFNSVWTNQSSRLAELQKTTGSFVDELILKNTKVVEEMEKKVESWSQQLRQAANEEKMNQLLSQISGTLDMISEKYRLVFNDECEAIKKYIESVAHEIPEIVKQFDTFVDSYGPTLLTNNIETDSPDSNHLDFVKQHRKLCENLVSMIFDWKTKLLSEIIEFRDNFPEEIRSAAEDWKFTISSQRASVLRIKLEANSQRFEDIKKRIYEFRIQEIERHSKHFETHEMEVNETVKDTSDRLDTFFRGLKQSFEIYERDILRTSEKFPEAKSTAAIKRFQKEIERIREKYKGEVEHKEKDCREQLHYDIDSLTNKNENFLNELKLFKDGGNFSPEEVKLYRKSLTSCGKTISEAKTAQSQRIDKTIKELSQAIEKTYKTNLDRINTTMREIKFHEDSQKILTKCAVVIERRVYRLLEDDTRFVNTVVDFVEESAKVSCADFNVTSFADQCIRLSNMLDRRLNNLLVAFPTVKDDPPNNRGKETRKSSVGDKRKRQKSENKVINYRILFLGDAETPASDDFFATVAMNVMLKTIDELQTKAKIFFSPTGKRNETEAIYHEYMSGILHQMNCYRQQLEFVWQREVSDVLNAMEAFDQTITNCIRNNFDECHKQHVNEINVLKEEKLRSLKKIIEEFVDRRNELLDSLEMTHGNPRRKDSLDNLSERVLQEEEAMENTITSKLDEFKKKSQELVDRYETSLLTRADMLRNVMSKTQQNRNERQRLKELSDAKTRTASPQLKEMPYKLDIAETTDRRFSKYRRDLNSPVDDLDMESLINNYLEKAKSLHRSSIKDVDAEAEEFITTADNFRQNWKSNIETVIEVYAMLL